MFIGERRKAKSHIRASSREIGSRIGVFKVILLSTAPLSVRRRPEDNQTSKRGNRLSFCEESDEKPSSSFSYLPSSLSMYA